jgi:Holliday junction DNA helicase RuvB
MLAKADVAALLGVRVPEQRHLRVAPDPPQRERTVIVPNTHTFDDFIGNTDAILDLLPILEDAEASGDAVYPHILLHGAFGTGKTDVAKRIAKRRGTKLRIVDDGRKLRDEKRVAMLFSDLSEGDIVFIDEIHRLRGGEEALYSLMDTGEFTVRAGTGRDETMETIKVPPFTLIGATTSFGSLEQPFLSRFVDIELHTYTDAEISLILRQSARAIGVEMTDDGADALAVLARGTARIAKVGLLTRAKAAARLIARSMADADGKLPEPVIDRDAVELMQQNAGIDRLGLRNKERELLRALCLTMTGGPIGMQKLSEASGLSIDSAQALEGHLFREQLMFFDGRGRKARVEAYQLLSEIDGTIYPPPARVVGWTRNQGMPAATQAWLDSIVR